MEAKPIIDEATIIQRNVDRWRGEQDRKAERRAKRDAEAKKQLLKELGREPKPHEIARKVRFILKEKHAKFLLRECRATIGEIVATHGKKL